MKLVQSLLLVSSASAVRFYFDGKSGPRVKENRQPTSGWWNDGSGP